MAIERIRVSDTPHLCSNSLDSPYRDYYLTLSLSVGCLLLLCGRLADILGNKKLFLIGSAWFSIWLVVDLSSPRCEVSTNSSLVDRSIAAAFAQTPWSFILFVGMQGIGSGMHA